MFPKKYAQWSAVLQIYACKGPLSIFRVVLDIHHLSCFLLKKSPLGNDFWTCKYLHSASILLVQPNIGTYRTLFHPMLVWDRNSVSVLGTETKVQFQYRFRKFFWLQLKLFFHFFFIFSHFLGEYKNLILKNNLKVCNVWKKIWV